MDSGRKNIKELFVSNFFYIPDYQRNYSWEDKQIKDFYDDFKAKYLGANKNYYYGTILLQKQSPEESCNRYDIVDGQQRLTTLIIFIKCLLKTISEKTNRPEDFSDDDIDELYKKYILKKSSYFLNAQSEDNEFFHTYILGDNLYIGDIKTPSQRKLLKAKESFLNLLKNEDEDILYSFMDKIEAAIILVYMVTSRSEASLIFETTNDRGKPLSNLEKTKSYLMYKASLLDDSEQLLETIQARFNSIYQDYAFLEENQIDEDTILQYCFIAFENWNGGGSQKAYQHYMEEMKNKTDSLLDNNKFDEFREYVDTYTLNIKESFAIIKQLYNSNIEEFKDLRTLNVMYNFYPLIIKCFKLDTEQGKANFKKICRLLEIFVFRVYAIIGYKTYKYQTKWFELAKTFAGDFDSLGNSIVDIIRHEDFGGDEAFINALQDKNFYDKHSSNIKNYFYWKYENYLRTVEQPICRVLTHDYLKKEKGSKTNATIEHIVARKNTDEQSKIIADDDIVVVGQATTFNKEYLNSIGNLTLDPQSANSSKGASDVDEKISKYFVKAPLKCQNELPDFLINGKWKRESIDNRRDKLLKFAKQLWCDYGKYYVDNVEAQVIEAVDEDDDEE